MEGMTKRPAPVASEFALTRESVLTGQRAVTLFQKFMEGTEDLPPKIKMEHAGNAWQMAVTTAKYSS
jgi:hypothetical protein